MNLQLAEHASEIETRLRAHPGVREAVVLLWRSTEADPRLVAYVVPNNEYLDRTLAEANDESRRIQKWRKTYELTQSGRESAISQPDFNILGWNSSYTRLAIPEDQMREWVDLTLQEIQRFKPSEVLELGCGAGLLLLRLARRCRRYVGVDNSPAVLEALKRQMNQLGGAWPQVELLERGADQFDGFAMNSFDTLIINSVTQHFPSLNYLLNILEKAVRVVRPGGRIFLGDLRSLPLQGPFATSVELFQAAPEMDVAQLRERIRKRIRLDEQLILSPALFSALGQRWPEISHVELQPRQGRFDNEMNRYRFNAVLHLGAKPSLKIEPTWLSWPREKAPLESIASALEKQNLESFGLTQVRNRRIEKDVLAFRELPSRSGLQTVGSFKTDIQQTADHGIDPQDLWSLGTQLGYDVQMSWAASKSDGSYDALFLRKHLHEAPNTALVAWPGLPMNHEDLTLFANAPTKAVPREKLLRQLRECCEQFPSEAMPPEIILMNELALAPDGKLDRQTLPSPDAILL